MTWNYNDVMKDPLATDWFTTRGIKEATRKMYASGFAHFLNMTGKTPKELLEDAENEIKTGTLMRERKIKQHLLQFMRYLDENVSPGSKSSYFSAVKSFYEAYDIDLPKLKNGSGEVLEGNKYNGMTVEVIRTVITHTESLKERAMILATISSGMGENEIVSLKVGQLKNVDENGICTLFMRRDKKRIDFITFLSPEAVKAIQLYLDERNRDPETKVLSDDDYIFITTHKYDKPTRTCHTPMRPRNCAEIMRTITDRMGQNKEGVYNPYRPHNWRKFFFNALIDNGCDYFFAEFLMGHKLDKTRSAYFKANPEKTKLKYLRFLKFLTIEDTETHLIESKEYTELKKENEYLHDQVRGLQDVVEKQNSEVGAFRDELEQHYKDIEKQLEAKMNAQIGYMLKKLTLLPPDVRNNFLDKSEAEEAEKLKSSPSPSPPPTVPATPEEIQENKNNYEQLLELLREDYYKRKAEEKKVKP